jgi:hypothetical protein
MGFISDAIGGVFGTVNSGLGKGAVQDKFQASSPGLYDQTARRQRYAQALIDAQNRNEDTSPFRNAQTGLVGQLQAQAQGQGPSVAEQQLKAAQDQNMQQALALAASARGNVNPAMAQRVALQSQAQANQQSAQQAAVLKAQEQLQAQNQLGQLAGQGRSQDQSFQQLKDNFTQFYEQMGLSAEEAELNAQMAAQQINAGIAANNSAAQNQFIGGIYSGLAGIGASAVKPGNTTINQAAPVQAPAGMEA